MAEFPERLKQLRIATGYSQQKLADLLNVSKSTINMYERGERKPGVDQLEAIADCFNVDMDYLRGKSDIPRKTLIGTGSSSSAEFKITELEKQVIISYRNNPDMRAAVNKLLDVKEQSKVIELDYAARSDDGSTPTGKMAITEEQLDKIKNAPKIDDL